MYVLTDPTTGKPPGTGTEDFLLLPAVTPVSFLSDAIHRGGFVGLLGLRIVIQVVAASLGLAVAAVAVF